MLPFKHLNTSSPGWNASWYLCSLATVGCTMNSYYSQTFLALRDGNRIISSKQTTRKTAKNVLGHTAVVIQNDDIDMMKWFYLHNDDKSYHQQCLNYVLCITTCLISVSGLRLRHSQQQLPPQTSQLLWHSAQCGLQSCIHTGKSYYLTSLLRVSALLQIIVNVAKYYPFNKASKFHRSFLFYLIFNSI